jgi:hypothetical protein
MACNNKNSIHTQLKIITQNSNVTTFFAIYIYIISYYTLLKKTYNFLP